MGGLEGVCVGGGGGGEGGLMSAGSFPEQRLVIKPTHVRTYRLLVIDDAIRYKKKRLL